MKVIFACTQNAGRSQMAAAFFNQLADPQKAYAISAGTKPGPHVHPSVLKAMKSFGVDLSHVKPQLLTEDLTKDSDLLVTMGCGETCPYVPELKRDDWAFADPKDKSDDEVCEIRDEIRARVVKLLSELDVQYRPELQTTSNL